MERRAQQLVLVCKAFVYVSLVQLCFGGNGFGRGLGQTLSCHYADGALYENLPDISLLQGKSSISNKRLLIRNAEKMPTAVPAAAYETLNVESISWSLSLYGYTHLYSTHIVP